MDDRREILWRLYQDVVTQGRHHETQRLGLTNVVLVTTAAALGLVSVDSRIAPSDAPVGAFLVVLGVVGAVFSLKQYERFRNHMEYASQYRRALDVDGLDGLRRQAKHEHETQWSGSWRRAIRMARLHWWWAFLHLVVSVLGAVLLVVSMTS